MFMFHYRLRTGIVTKQGQAAHGNLTPGRWSSLVI